MAGTNDNFYMFSNTFGWNDVTKFTLMRGVTDYSDLRQFDLYETGYSFLICLGIPTFMEVMAHNHDAYKNLIKSYNHIVEYEFRGAQGIEDITADTSSITNGIDELNLITKVREQAGTSFSMQYFEKSGSIITKTHEAFLRGIKDPRTQVKRYNGLLNKKLDSVDGKRTSIENASSASTMVDKGYQYEVFNYMLIITDNTALNVEKAYILSSCQPANAPTNIYNVTKGDIQFSEISVQMNGFPIAGRIVNEKANTLLAWINKHTCFDEMMFGYNILNKEALNNFTEDSQASIAGDMAPQSSSPYYLSQSDNKFIDSNGNNDLWNVPNILSE